jgi:DNA-binding beta-propeller fold protein YncE
MIRPSNMAALAATAIPLALAGCGATGPRLQRRPPAPARVAPRAPAPRSAARARVQAAPAPLQALVTAQTENRLLVVDLPSGHVARRVTVPGDPEYVATSHLPSSIAAVVSSGSGTVTLLNLDSLRPIKAFHGFVAPHIPAISPDAEHAYVTDDASGKVTVIGLYNDRVLSRVSVGAGAHHLAFSPDWRQVWVALGQSARTIVILSTVISTPPPPSSPVGDPGHPHVIGHLVPGFLAHDLLFSPDGKRVWVTSASTAYVGVFSARSHRLLFRVPGGPPPQHVAFDGQFAYVTSGYGSRIEQVAVNTGRVIRRAGAPYGSFDLDAAGGYVVTSSLFRGTLAIYDSRLRLLHIRHLAPSTEDVTIRQP